MSTDPNSGWSILAFFRQVVKTSGPKFLLLIATGLSFSQIAAAQTLPCGNIVAPGEWETDLWLENPIESVPITDCNLPFGEVDEWGEGERKLLFTIEGLLVNDGDTFPVLDGRTKKYDFEYNFVSPYSTYGHVIFRHQNNNYEFVDSRSVPLTETDYRELAIEFGVAEENIEEYVARLMSEDPYEGLVYGTPEYQSFDEFDSFVYTAAEKNYPYLESGTYTIVYHFYEQESAWDEPYLASRHADIFTITSIETEPIGASSVLFLPGIQASRLYIEEDGGENRIWEPNINADVSKLEMTDGGSSVNEIYTRDVLDEIYDVNNVYKSFLNMLEDLESNEIIADSLAFAYDWRFGIQDIIVSGTKYENEIKSLVDEVEALSAGSYTNKVTIIGHSNGGLVAKALIRELERLDMSDLVDKLVMVGTPQLGTPKAIGSMLHGLDQQAGAGLIVDDETARTVIKNMPGAYTLLPSQKYFDKSGDIVVTSDQSEDTASVRAYGEINSTSELNSFLLDTNNLRDDEVSINEPATLNSVMIDNLTETRTWLDDWAAPASIDIYEVIGTGITTIKGFEYRSFPCTFAVAVVCASGQYMKPYPIFSSEGDETVMALSAGGYEGDKISAKVDLIKEGAQLSVFEKRHVNLTESPTVQEYLDSIIRFPYLNETLEIPEDFIETSREYTIVGSHSPVALTLEDDAGNQAGIVDGEVAEDIPGSQYIELGGSSYIIVPKETDYTAKIKGTGSGVYSVTVDTLDGDDVQTSEYVYKGASTTPLTEATFTASSSGFSNIETDLDGDGLIDLEQTLDGEIISPVIVYTYDDLTVSIKELGLAKLLQQFLLIQVQLAERFSMNSDQVKLEALALRGIEDTLKLYERKGLISSTQSAEIQEIINYLKN